MKRTLICLLIVFCFAFAKVGYSQSQPPASKVETPKIGIKLAYGDMADLGKVQLKFKEVISDSRCPSDVTCMWEGEAKVVVEIYENGILNGEKTLVFTGTHAPVLNVISAVIKVDALALQPYPKTETPKDKAEYYLVLQSAEK